MYCKHCGNQLPDDANFCQRCGNMNENVVKEEIIMKADENESSDRVFATAEGPLSETAAEVPAQENSASDGEGNVSADASVAENAAENGANQSNAVPAASNDAPRYESYEEMKRDERKGDLAGKILKFGILGLAFGTSLWLSFLGIIFSAIAKSKTKLYIKEFGETEGRATVGKNLAKAGLIVSIVMTAIFVFYFLIIAVGLASFLFEFEDIVIETYPDF